MKSFKQLMSESVILTEAINYEDMFKSYIGLFEGENKQRVTDGLKKVIKKAKELGRRCQDHRVFMGWLEHS